jgi:hypothetical protein
MHWLFRYQFWMGVLAGLFLLRQLMIILAAEQGRKHDLVKKRYKSTQEFRISVLIPFLDPNDHPALLGLLRALYEQDYPTTKVTIHLVTSEESQRDVVPQSLRANVRVWQYPEPHPRYEQALTWLIDRCLAAGGNNMFVFLKPTDIVKPDFFQNIVSRGLDSFAIQGYVALKNLPETPLAKAKALSTRLFNRIGNAGRYHLGMSCRLLDSGWAIKQEVLEMIPYRRGMDLDNLEYSIRLSLENFRVNWAPSVVVYSDSDVDFMDHLTLCVGTLLNRLRLLATYGPPLLTRMLLRFDINNLEQLFSIVKPPYLAITLFLLVMAIVSLQKPVPGGMVFWTVTALLTLSVQVLALVVARCKANDFAAMIFHTPVAYMLGLLTSPLGLFNIVNQTLNKRARQGRTYRKLRKTRFNEELDAPPDLFDETHGQRVIQGILKKNAPLDSDEAGRGNANRLPQQRNKQGGPQRQASAMAARTQTAELSFSIEEMTPYSRAPKETVRSVPLSNGRKQVNCVLKTLTTYNEEGQEAYRLTLEYKTMAFSTESYRILDQAFYELHAKLVSKGLTIIACGSCGNFYNPTADQPGALKNTGVCLSGKIGQEVNLNTDAVTVISSACEAHCPLENREAIVRQWKESLNLSRTH